MPNINFPPGDSPSTPRANYTAFPWTDPATGRQWLCRLLPGGVAQWNPFATGGASADNTPYGSGWNGVTTIAPSKNAVYDKIESLAALELLDAAPLSDSHASLTLAFAGDDNNLLVTATNPGAAGNAIALQLIGGSGTLSTMTVTVVDGNLIRVLLRRTGGIIQTLAHQLRTAINNHPEASLLVQVTPDGSDGGSYGAGNGEVAALGVTLLAGGVDGTVASHLGQVAISIIGGQRRAYTCTRLEPVEWQATSDAPPDVLDFAGNDPNIPEQLTVAGITDPADTDPLILARGSNYNDYPTWGVGLFLRWEPVSGGTWQLSDGFSFGATTYSTAPTPVGLTDWSVEPGAGTLVVTGDAPAATYLGQRCLATSGWWTWNGTLWTRDGTNIYTALEVTTLLQGAKADQTRIGVEYMPEALVAQLVPVTVLDADARKDAASYSDPTPGVLRVTQTSLPGILWNLVALPVTSDSSWIGLPYTVDPDGDVVVSMELADVTGTVPSRNVLGLSKGTLRLGDGRTTDGQSVVSPPPSSLTLIADAANAVTGFPATAIPASFASTLGTVTTFKGLSIGSGVTSIGSSAFSGCTGLMGDLIIPDSVTTIGANAFNGCTGFTGRLILGKSTTTIDQNAFTNGNFTGNLILPDSLTSFPSSATFQACDQFTGDLVIPPSFTNFGSGKAFQNCSGFNGALYLPASLTVAVKTTDFSGCTGFTRIYAACNADKVTAGSFTTMTAVTTIYYKAGTTGWGTTFDTKPTAVWTSWPDPMP